jgi:competence protein ComEC
MTITFIPTARLRCTLALGALLAVVAVGGGSAAAQDKAAQEEDTGLRIIAIDVEGGAATLIVTPAGESVLIDSGFPGERDAGRILAAAKEAGLSEITHYITTHWHADHVGGSPELARQIPILHWYGHQIPDPLGSDINSQQIEAWRAAAGEPIFLRAGDSIPLKGTKGAPDPRLRIVAADGLVLDEKADAPAIQTCDDGYDARPEDTTDNARSLAWLFSYGDFDLFAGGDLTWNIEHKFICPKRVVRKVDVYLADHHGSDSSNHPGLVKALDPTVIIVNNGPRKGGEPRSIQLFIDTAGDTGVFQLHRALRDGAVNVETGRIANYDEDCKAVPLLLTVDRSARSYTVTNPSRDAERRFIVW